MVSDVFMVFFTISEPPAADGLTCKHPLHDTELCSPLRALPGIEQRFKHHVAIAHVILGATHERLRVCKRLLSEQVDPPRLPRLQISIYISIPCFSFSFSSRLSQSLTLIPFRLLSKPTSSPSIPSRPMSLFTPSVPSRRLTSHLA